MAIFVDILCPLSVCYPVNNHSFVSGVFTPLDSVSPLLDGLLILTRGMRQRNSEMYLRR